jgi:transcriptional regulator with XRE-family HTH domain
MSSPPTTLASQLERLFAEVRKPDGARYTQAEVVAGTHGALTRVYLWKLRTGRAVKPSFQVIQALADFFGVETDFFIAELPAEALDLNRAPGRYTQQIMERAAQMDERSRKAVLDLMDFLLSLQGED